MQTDCRKRGSKLDFILPLMGSLTVTIDPKAQELLDSSSGVLVIINHTSEADTVPSYLQLRKLFGREVSFMAKAGLWKIPILSTFLTWKGFIPVHRGTSHAADSLVPAEDALRDGCIVVMYPEGGIEHWTSSEDRLPAPFRTGAARLMIATGVPVLVMILLGARKVMSGSKLKKWLGLMTAWLRRPQMHIYIGAPIMEVPSKDPREVTEFLHKVMCQQWEKAYQQFSATK